MSNSNNASQNHQLRQIRESAHARYLRFLKRREKSLHRELEQIEKEIESLTIDSSSKKRPRN